jgi:caspase domain-containing protein
LATLAPRANRQNFKDAARAWRTDASSNQADMTIFYFAGHGMQRGPEEGVLLLDDFLSDDDVVLGKAAELGNIRNGMAPSDACPAIGLTQFYFIDACLDRPKAQSKFVNPQVPAIFDVLLNVVDRREAPVLFSTFDGALSIGRRGKTSYFAEALIQAFERGAEDPEDEPTGGTRWPVTSLTIKNSLDGFYESNKLGTNVTLSSLVGLPVLRYLNDPPQVACKILVDPQRMNGTCKISVYDDVDMPAAGDWPQTKTEFDVTVKAGLYKICVDSNLLRTSPYKSKLKWITQKVKSWPHSLDSLLAR